MEPSGVRTPNANAIKSACMSVAFVPPSFGGPGAGGGVGMHGSGTHAGQIGQVFVPFAPKRSRHTSVGHQL